MGILDRVNQWVTAGPRPEKFEYSVGDPAFAGWLYGTDTATSEVVTPYTVLGLSAVIRSVSIISGTIAGLPLRTYERQGDERVRVPSVFDDPFPGIEGSVPFAWVETILIHELLWRNAYLWHEGVDGSGFPSAYKPMVPDSILKVEVVGGRKRFTYRDEDNIETTVGTEQITHIPGPSIDGVIGHPLLYMARRIFSAALAGDKSASTTLALGIRLGGIISPAEGEDIDTDEGEAIVQSLRPKLLGSSNAGDIAFLNKRLKLDQWTPNNVDSQWHEARLMVIDEVGRIFGVPPHLLNAIEKQTSWGTGVAEQNRGLAVFTLKHWSDRIEQTLTRRLPKGQFCEFDYAGLLQGTPAQEIELLIKQVDAGLLTIDEARKIRNLPPLTAAQKAETAARSLPAIATNGHSPIRQEATA